MSVRLLRHTVFAVAMLSVAIGVRAAESVKLAVITPLSGPFALQGEDAVKQFRGIADLIKSRGGVIDGRPLEIVPLDGKAAPQDGLFALKQAIDHPIICGHAHLDRGAHARGCDHQAKRAQPGTTSASPDLRCPRSGADRGEVQFLAFPFHLSHQLRCEFPHGLPRQGNPMCTRSICSIRTMPTASRSAARLAKCSRESTPTFQIVGDDLVPLGKVKDFAPYVAKIRAAEADGVITGNWGNDLSLLVKAAHEAGLKARFYTFVAYSVGVASAIGSAGVDRVWGVFPWLANAQPNPYEKYNAEFKAKYKSPKKFDYAPIYRIGEMLTAAIGKAQTTDPVKVAYALEGLHYSGAGGEAWMRADDHQVIAPLYLASFVKAGGPGVKFDVEDTGYGWKQEGKVDATDAVPEMKCNMQRP